jgi:MoxR-like ATPase
MTRTASAPALSLAAVSGKLQAIRQELNAVCFERGPVVNAILLALVAKQNVILLGPPGTGKSMLVREVVRRVTNTRDFEKMLNKFISPEELFGPVSMTKLQQDVFERVIDGYLPDVHIAFLDEVGKCSTAALNTMLDVMIDKVFRNGNQTINVPMMSVIGASNEVPSEEGLQALWDRFLLRFEVKRLSPAGRFKMMRAECDGLYNQAPTATMDLQELQWIQAQLYNVVVSDDVLSDLNALVGELDQEGVSPTDRRVALCTRLVRASALINGRMDVTEDDVEVLQDVLWDNLEDIQTARKYVIKHSNPLKSRAVEILDSVKATHEKVMDLVRQHNGDVTHTQQQTMADNSEVMKLKKELQESIKRNSGAPCLQDLKDMLDDVERLQKEFVEAGTGLKM